jgi:hypothetical protein
MPRWVWWAAGAARQQQLQRTGSRLLLLLLLLQAYRQEPCLKGLSLLVNTLARDVTQVRPWVVAMP